MRSQAGQSTVELVGLLPLLLAVGLAVYSALAAGAAESAAHAAAEAGAVALLQHRDAKPAMRAALDGWPRRRYEIRIAGDRVSVEVTPRGPFGRLLSATETASAAAP
jgi:hypothetical protein